MLEEPTGYCGFIFIIVKTNAQPEKETVSTNSERIAEKMLECTY